MIRRPPRSTLSSSSAASDVYKRQYQRRVRGREPGKMTSLLGHALQQTENLIEQQLLDPEEDPDAEDWDNDTRGQGPPSYQELMHLARQDFRDSHDGGEPSRLMAYTRDLVESVRPALDDDERLEDSLNDPKTQRVRDVLESFNRQMEDSMDNSSKWKRLDKYDHKIGDALRDHQSGDSFEVLRDKYNLGNESEEFFQYLSGLVTLEQLRDEVRNVRLELEHVRESNEEQGKMLMTHTLATGQQLLQTAKNEADVQQMREQFDRAAAAKAAKAESLLEGMFLVDSALVMCIHDQWSALGVSELSLVLIDRKLQLLQDMADQMVHPLRNSVVLEMLVSQVHELKDWVPEFGFKCKEMIQGSRMCKGDILKGFVHDGGHKRWLVLRNRTLRCFIEDTEDNLLWKRGEPVDLAHLSVACAVSLRPLDAAIKAVEMDSDQIEVTIVLVTPPVQACSGAGDETCSGMAGERPGRRNHE
eukprot:TRINITY_DN3290_c0_g1_i14.p1 TRINITY_DN3290_c0_g1~~TRINITY_DN3290_c0_g1_i14.p1  ORF type:complete len:473 (+),score=136.30 TRINITY_DN3290_c0_g1_i14:126-1544(+)